MGYIRFPIETDPETLVQEFYAYVQSFYPNYNPNDANLDVIIARFFAFKAGEIRDLASDVQDDIFRFYGATMIALPPFDAVQATGNTTWTVKDTAGYTIPVGTAVALTTTDGTSVPFITTTDVTIPPGSTATAAGAVLIQAIVAGSQANNLTGTVQLIDTKDFVTSVAIVGSTSGGVDAEIDSDYLSRLTRHLQRLSTRPILPNDFAMAAFDASAEVDRAVALDGYNPIHNLLTANQASAETDATGAAAASNTTLASTSAQAADGTKSISLTAIAGGNIGASIPGIIPPAAGSIVVSPGDVVTGLVSVRSATTARSTSATLRFYNAAGASIAAIVGPGANDSNAAWTPYTVVAAIAPALSAFVRLEVNIIGVGVSEVHYIDKQLIRRGTSTVWVPGGTPETGNEKMIAVSAINEDGTAISGPAKTAVQNYLQSQREVGFSVSIIDPTYTSIDVTATFKTLPGFDVTTAENNVEAAINNYLASKNWGVDASDPHLWIESKVVYRNEMIALISNVQEVDRVVTLQMGITGSALSSTSDIGIGSPAALTQPGTITATAV
jgi:hypothetical protein